MKFIDARKFFKSLKISWIKRYATNKLDNQWVAIIDMKLKLRKSTRAHILIWEPEALTCMISKNYPCIEGFFKAWLDSKTTFHFRPTETHNNLLHIFFNPWILSNPTVDDFANYCPIKPEQEFLKLESFSLSNDDCSHRKIIDMLGE